MLYFCLNCKQDNHAVLRPETFMEPEMFSDKQNDNLESADPVPVLQYGPDSF